MSTKLHPEYARDLIESARNGKDSDGKSALKRAATHQPGTTGGSDESGEDKLARAADHNDAGGGTAGKDKAQ